MQGSNEAAQYGLACDAVSTQGKTKFFFPFVNNGLNKFISFIQMHFPYVDAQDQELHVNRPSSLFKSISSAFTNDSIEL